MKDQLIYPVADALNIALHEMKDGRVRGADARKLNLGGMVIEAEMIVVSDVVDDSQAGYFVRLTHGLWLYMVVTDQGKGMADLEAHSFDANVLELKVKDAVNFGGKSISATMERLKPAMRESFKFLANGKHWAPIDVPCLDHTE